MSSKHIQTQGPLFEAVQLSRVFSDSKTFPDCTVRKDPDAVLIAFREVLAQFVQQHFEMPLEQAAYVPPQTNSMDAHIDKLWEFLQRPPDKGNPTSSSSSLLALPYPYVVAGEGFREIYYWDSYFTCEGLAASARLDLVEGMIKNFAYLIEQVGHIPNGNRVYYLSRSQSPFFCCMLQLLEREKGFDAIQTYIPSLEKEYRYWMDGQKQLSFGQGTVVDDHVVVLDGEMVLNRYWDRRNVPREEAFAEDFDLFQQAGNGRQKDLYRDLRAAAESGWNFSSRWLAPGGRVESIQTTHIVPVDLNCLLYQIEAQFSEWLRLSDVFRSSEYTAAAQRRSTAIQKYCWHEESGWFFDYSWFMGKKMDTWSLAGVFPLFCRLVDDRQAQMIADNLAEKFLKPGGLVTTLKETGQSWDAPYGWAPLQWVAVQGLRNYHHDTLADEIARRFVHLAEKVYQKTGKMMEKYNVCELGAEINDSEYIQQGGFGWTNGVVKAFLKLLGD